MDEMTFKMAKGEAQFMLDALAKEPYEKVFALINKIQEQASEQMAQGAEQADKFGVDVETKE